MFQHKKLNIFCFSVQNTATPQQLKYTKEDDIMRIFEVLPIKPLTPQQARINALKQQKERAAKLLQAEKDRQRKQKATQQMQKAQQTLTKLQSG